MSQKKIKPQATFLSVSIFIVFSPGRKEQLVRKLVNFNILSVLVNAGLFLSLSLYYQFSEAK